MLAFVAAKAQLRVRAELGLHARDVLRAEDRLADDGDRPLRHAAADALARRQDGGQRERERDRSEMEPTVAPHRGRA